jgi:hydrogenase 3 maturation protease
MQTFNLRNLKNKLKGVRRVAILAVGSDIRQDDAAGILVAKSLVDTFAASKPHPSGCGRETPLSINPETDPGFKPGDSRRVDFRGTGKIPCRIFIGGAAPENFTSEIKRFKSSHILIVDAAYMGLKPGAVRLIDACEETTGVSFSTHKLPFKILADYLIAELSCSVLLIAIEPKALEIYQPPSAAVKSSCRKVANLIREAVKG